jgi:hypothetical protein
MVRRLATGAALDRGARVWVDLPAQAQLKLARQCVRMQGAALQQTYPDIVGIGYGYRTVGREQTVLLSEPCLTFMVRRKWRRGLAGADRAHLPRHVITDLNIAGKRHRCAIPTDVTSLMDFRHVEPRAQVHAVSPGLGSLRGPLCCAVRLQQSGQLYGVGCHHVLALSKLTAEFGRAGLHPRVAVQSDPAPRRDVGELSDYYGLVEDGVFFDAALAKITHPDVLANLLAEPFPGTVALTSETNLPQTVTIHSFKGGLLSATVSHVWHAPTAPPLIKYIFLEARFGTIRPKTVVQVKLDTHTQNGDSGSPVFSLGGAIFQGMLIAGSDAGTPKAFFIPAYELLKARNYGLASGDEMLTLAFPPF